MLHNIHAANRHHIRRIRQRQMVREMGIYQRQTRILHHLLQRRNILKQPFLQPLRRQRQDKVPKGRYTNVHQKIIHSLKKTHSGRVPTHKHRNVTRIRTGSNIIGEPRKQRVR